MNKTSNRVVFLILVFIVALLRLLPHEPNFVPLGALALFSGYYFPKKYAFVAPIVVMLITDSLIGFHSTMIWVYGSYALITVLGQLIGTKIALLKIISFSLLSSIIFFTFTNFGVWFSTNLYSKDINGLAQCFTLAIPFFRNTFLGDMFYSGIFFTVYSFVQSRSFIMRSIAQKNTLPI